MIVYFDTYGNSLVNMTPQTFTKDKFLTLAEVYKKIEIDKNELIIIIAVYIERILLNHSKKRI